MRILHVSAQLPTRTGSGVYFSNLIEYMDDEDIVHGAVYGVQEPFEFNITGEWDFPVRFNSERLPFPIVGMSDVMPYKNTRYKDMTDKMINQWKVAFSETIEQAVEKFNPDIIIAHHLWMVTSLILEEFSHIPVYAFSHYTDIRQAKSNPHLKEKHSNNIYNARKVFALSNLHIPEIEEVFQVPKENILVSGAGYNQNIFFEDNTKRYDDKIIIVFCGKIEQSKGVFELVKAFKEISEERDDVYLDIIGDGDKESIKRLHDIQLESRHVLRYNAEDQIWLGNFFRRSDIIVLPSFYEGLGLVILEGLGSGLRAVSTEIDGLMELLGEKVNDSDVIEYVKLPRIINTDEPLKEDLPAYRKELTKALRKQIQRVEEEKEIDPEITKEIQTHSWAGLAKRVLESIREDVCNI